MVSVENFQLFVKTSSIDSTFQFPITFGCLETLDVAVLDFILPIERNDKIKVLSLPMTKTRDFFNEILETIRKLPELEEISLKWDDGITCDVVEQLVDSRETLRKITFPDESLKCSDVEEIIPNGWHFGQQSGVRLETCTILRD